MEMNPMNFGDALALLKDGKRVMREGWNGKDKYLMYIDPYNNDQYGIVEEETIVGTLARYIAIKNADNLLVPWAPSQTDVLFDDWYEVACG